MTEEVKTIGKYKLKCKTTSDNSDFINLHIEPNDTLKELIKSVVITEVSDCQIRTGVRNSGEDEYFRFQRHKVKRWIYGSIYSDEARDILFAKELVKKGVIDIPFTAVDRLESFVEGLKRATKSLIETFNSYKDMEFEVTYKCAGENETD